jgi:hypothetical protein
MAAGKVDHFQLVSPRLNLPRRCQVDAGAGHAVRIQRDVVAADLLQFRDCDSAEPPLYPLRTHP